MSQDVERVYTVNLGKVLLSPDNQRAKRAINMIKEFARHHMKTEQVKIEEDVSHLIWSRGIKHPPRKIRVRMTRTDEGYILVSKYEGEEETIEKEEKKAEPEKVEPEPAKAEPAKAEPETEKAEPAKVEPEPKPAAKSEPKPAAKSEPKPAAKSEPKPAAKSEPKPAAKPEPKPAAKPEPKPAAKSDDVPEFFKKKDQQKKPKSKSKD